MKKLLFSIFIALKLSILFAQNISIMHSETQGSSLRGLSVVNDNVVWVSGSKGTVGKSIDGGKSWKFMTVQGFEKNEFRDIEAFDDMTAVIMGIDCPAYILQTIDGGLTWNVVFKDTTKGMFLDAVEFWNNQSGIVIGDPIDHRFFVARTFDGGKNWQPIPYNNRPVADVGEACFASSGTNIQKLNKTQAVFISGGTQSHLFIKNKKITIPIIQGAESTGANSLAINNNKKMIIVGGDFYLKDATNQNIAITKNAGKDWEFPQIPPHGYRSCIEFIRKNIWITCGLNGVDISKDDGTTFIQISNESFNVCKKAKKGRAVFLAGNHSKIAKLID